MLVLGNIPFVVSTALLTYGFATSDTFPAILLTASVTVGSVTHAAFNPFIPSGIAPNCIPVLPTCCQFFPVSVLRSPPSASTVFPDT